MAHILLLEDDLDLTKNLEQILALDQHTVASFSAVDEALKYFQSKPVDLVIADLFIKDGGAYSNKGGVTLMSVIRQVNGSAVPIIAMSGSFYASGKNANQAILAKGTSATVGANATLAKPFQPQSLLQIVKRLLDPVLNSGMTSR